jgi:hypothetical protein
MHNNPCSEHWKLSLDQAIINFRPPLAQVFRRITCVKHEFQSLTGVNNLCNKLFTLY